MDVPYEVRMKYIIQAYKKDQERWAELSKYTKQLEGEVIRLKCILIENEFTDSGLSEDWTPEMENFSYLLRNTRLKSGLCTWILFTGNIFFPLNINTSKASRFVSKSVGP